jgi:hypothetical protein
VTATIQERIEQEALKRERVFKAAATGAPCAKCGRSLEPGEAVYRHGYWIVRYVGDGHAPVCAPRPGLRSGARMRTRSTGCPACRPWRRAAGEARNEELNDSIQV